MEGQPMQRRQTIPSDDRPSPTRALDRLSTWVVVVAAALFLTLAGVFIAREFGLTGTAPRLGPGVTTGSATSPPPPTGAGSSSGGR